MPFSPEHVTPVNLVIIAQHVAISTILLEIIPFGKNPGSARILSLFVDYTAPPQVFGSLSVQGLRCNHITESDLIS